MSQAPPDPRAAAEHRRRDTIDPLRQSGLTRPAVRLRQEGATLMCRGLLGLEHAKAPTGGRAGLAFHIPSQL